MYICIRLKIAIYELKQCLEVTSMSFERHRDGFVVLNTKVL